MRILILTRRNRCHKNDFGDKTIFDRLIYTLGLFILGKRLLYIESGPDPHFYSQHTHINTPAWRDDQEKGVKTFGFGNSSSKLPTCMFMMTSSNGNIFRVTGHLCEEFTRGAGNSPVTGEFHAQRPVTRLFDVIFDKRLSKQLWGWWFKTPLRPLWRHSNVVFWMKWWSE